MQQTFLSSIFISILVSSAALAEGQQGHAMNHEAMQQQNPIQMKAMSLTEGVAKKIDQKSGKITLQHGDIASVKMPAMTMSYRVKQTQWPEGMHAGDRVRFAVDKLNGEFIVTYIEIIK